MIDFLAIVAGDAVFRERLADRPCERREFVDISQRQTERVIVHEKEPVSSPGYVADDWAVSGYFDLNICGTAMAGNVVDGDVAIGVEGRFDLSYGRFDLVCAWRNALHVGEGGDESDGAVATHAQVADIVEEDDAGGAVAVHRCAEESADDDVGTARFGDDCRAEGIVIAAKALEAF